MKGQLSGRAAMAISELNRLASSLQELCAQHPIEEKWLIAPSRRIGQQWLDAVARSGQSVLNARIKTIASMAVDLASPEMERTGVSFLQSVEAEILLFGIMASLGDNGYLGKLSLTRGLVRAVLASLQDLRLEGIEAQELTPACFESNTKGNSMIRLLSLYQDELTSRHLADAAGVFKMAAAALRNRRVNLPEGLLITMPDDIEKGLGGLHRLMWEAFPENLRVILPTDLCDQTGNRPMRDASLLAWIAKPSDAPPPSSDGSSAIFRTAGAANEVREMLRRILEGGIPFDEVEVLYSNASAYVPLLFELCSKFSPEAGAGMPVTFNEGIPLRYSRPARALAGWLSFIKASYRQADLVRLIREGLLDFQESGANFSLVELTSEFRALAIMAGKDRYLPAIDAAVSSLERACTQNGTDQAEESRHLEKMHERLEMLRALRPLVENLLEWAPKNGKTWKVSLEGVKLFLERRARCVNELDEYARLRLLDEVEELSRCFMDDNQLPVDIEDWLLELVRFGRVEGEGPRPGCLYAAPLHSGGHSGRSHTFLLGLDDSRFPGAGLQDPLLLDAERARISRNLSTAGERLGESLEDFSRLAARIRGDITLSYSCRDITDDSEIFPSQVILAAYRILSGKHDGLLGDFLEWIPEPSSFAPDDPLRSLDMAEWWLSHLAYGSLEEERPLLAEAFPHLGHGLKAREARDGDIFTVYDGWVPEAGRDLDPSRPGGAVLSASRLEKLAKCPYEYFLQYVLEVKGPEEPSLDPSLWLEAKEKGDLLHVVFRRFHHTLARDGRKPDFERDGEHLDKILDAEVLAWKSIKPPPNREVFEAEVNELRNTASIFLYEEERSCRARKPLYFEVAVGLKSKGEGNAVDSEEPVLIALPDGSEIQVRGYIDRIDEAGEGREKAFVLCDYKTGSSKYFEGEDPFQAGRRVQGSLYVALAESRLAEDHPGLRIDSFEYFFPNTSEHGKRIGWSADELRQGLFVIVRLCEMLRLGCFPLSDNADDLKNSDYRSAFGDIQPACEAVKKKMARLDNKNLMPFAVLRGYQEEQP